MPTGSKSPLSADDCQAFWRGLWQYDVMAVAPFFLTDATWDSTQRFQIEDFVGDFRGSDAFVRHGFAPPGDDETEDAIHSWFRYLFSGMIEHAAAVNKERVFASSPS